MTGELFKKGRLRAGEGINITIFHKAKHSLFDKRRRLTSSNFDTIFLTKGL
jgi:hypothetical protein